MPRVFIALELPPAKREELEQFCKVNDSLSKFTWEDKSKLHLTIKFIGEMPAGDIERLKVKLAETKCSAVKTNFMMTSVISKNNSPSIVWASLRVTSELKSLVDACEEILSGNFSVQKEIRKYSPHITLLRVKPHYDFDEINKFEGIELNSDEFVMNKLVLYQSELFAKGSKYTELAEYDLVI